MGLMDLPIFLITWPSATRAPQQRMLMCIWMRGGSSVSSSSALRITFTSSTCAVPPIWAFYGQCCIRSNAAR